MQRPEIQQNQIDQCKIIRGHVTVLLVPRDQFKSLQQKNNKPPQNVDFRMAKFRRANFQLVAFGIEFRQAMTRTRNYVEQLRHGIKKVKNLGDEK